MMYAGRCICIFFLSGIVIFLFGCSGGKKQLSSEDTVSSQTVQETAAPSAESTVQAEPAAAEQVQPPAQPVQDKTQKSTEISEAQKKLIFAQNYLKMAQKGILGYNQVAAICRGVIRDYPDTRYVQQAQELLRQIPEDQRAQLNLTDEELGTE